MCLRPALANMGERNGHGHTPAGTQTLTINQDAAGWNINWFAFASGGGSCSAVPSAPTGLTATATSSSAIGLNWSAVTPPTNCTISGYNVYSTHHQRLHAGIRQPDRQRRDQHQLHQQRPSRFDDLTTTR